VNHLILGECHVFLAEFEGADDNRTFTKCLVMPDNVNYDDMWQVALNAAIEYQNSISDALLRNLTYQGYGFNIKP
jgi:hypothetical protein